MMSAPPSFSVEQLLQARQNGVPDYVVVPLLQKTIALKNAAAQQAALQAAPQKPPPIAQQVLGAAQQDQAREAGIAQLMAQQQAAQEAPEGMAGGGILAFAQGGEMPSAEELAAGAAEFTPKAPVDEPDEDAELEKSIQYGQKLRSFLGENPANEEMQNVYEERKQSAEASKDKAPWLALMKAGAAMAQSKSPYFMSALGEGLGAGAEEFENQAESYDKQVRGAQDLKVQLAQAKRAEDLAIMNHGISSHEAVLARKETAKYTNELKAQRMAEQERHNLVKEAQAQQFNNRMYSDVTANTAANIAARGPGRGGKSSGGDRGASGGKPLTAAGFASAVKFYISQGDDEATAMDKASKLTQVANSAAKGQFGSTQQQSTPSPFKHSNKYLQ